MSFNRISTRTVGQYPISIATSLALEAAFDIYPDRPPLGKQPIFDYDELWINLRTLYRNLIGSLDKDAAKAVHPEELAEGLMDDIEMINSIITTETNRKVSVVFYYCNYSDLEFHFKHSTIRMDNTDKQKEYTLIHNRTIKLVLDKQKQSQSNLIRVFDLKFQVDRLKRVLLLTNYAIDLLNLKSFSHLTLLESHSGHLKEKSQWYTKFSDSKELAQIPFRADMLQVFGDSTIFRPMDIRLRRDIIDLAKKYNWSSITTSDRIRYCVGQLQNPFYKEVLLNITSDVW